MQTTMENIGILSLLVRTGRMEQGVLFAEFGYDSFDRGFDMCSCPVSHVVMDVMVTGGALRMVIDNMEYMCTPEENSLICISPINVVTDIEPLPGFRGYIIALPQRFMDNAERGTKAIPLSDVLAMSRNNAITPCAGDRLILEENFRTLFRNAESVSNPIDKHIFRHSALVVHLQALKVMFASVDRSLMHPPVSRASALCDRFFELLMQNVERERDVVFYAGRLNISAHYLSRITKKVVGASAGKVITSEVMSRAYAMLRNPDYTLQQIADTLSFSDQSSFGKFFKKHAGMTPAAYRREYSR